MSSLETSTEIIECIEPDLFRVQPKYGVDVNRETILKTYASIDKMNAGQPFGILIERVHHYSISANGLRSIGDHPQVIATAVWVSPFHNWEIAKLQSDFFRIRPCPFEIFRDRESAILWLRGKVRLADDSRNRTRS